MARAGNAMTLPALRFLGKSSAFIRAPLNNSQPFRLNATSLPPVLLRLDAELDHRAAGFCGDRCVTAAAPALAFGFLGEKTSCESDARADEQETAKCDDYQFS